MLPYVCMLGLICMNFIFVILANVQVHVKAGCAIINGQSRCTTTDVGWFGVVDWIGLRDSVVITPDKKGNYWCDQCYNHITIYTDFPYTQGTEPPRFAKPKCELSLNILDGGDVLDLFLDYFPSQRTICLGYDQAAEGDERPIVRGSGVIWCCNKSHIYAGKTGFLNPYYREYDPYDGPGVPKLCYNCPSGIQHNGPKPESKSPNVTPNPTEDSNDADVNPNIEIEGAPADRRPKEEKSIPKATENSGDEQQAADSVLGADAGGSNDPLILALDDSIPTPSDEELPSNAGDMYASQPSTNFDLGTTVQLPSFDFSV